MEKNGQVTVKETPAVKPTDKKASAAEVNQDLTKTASEEAKQRLTEPR